MKSGSCSLARIALASSLVRQLMDTTVQGHCAPSQRVIAKPKALPLKGVPNAKAVGGIPVAVGGHWVVLPSVEISGETLDGGVVSGVGVTRGADGFVVKATDGGRWRPTVCRRDRLRSPFPYQVRPSSLIRLKSRPHMYGMRFRPCHRRRRAQLRHGASRHRRISDAHWWDESCVVRHKKYLVR